MKAPIIAMLALSSAVSAAVFAAAPTPVAASCAQIADVAVPGQVSLTATSLQFSSPSSHVAVTDGEVVANGKTFRDPSVQDYYAKLRGFLEHAGAMAKVAKSFTQHAAFPQAATDMCQSILAVQASSQRMEHAFPGFTSPVQVTLK